MSRRRRAAAAPPTSRSAWFATLVLVVAIWPLVQHALVRRYHGDPSRLGGFAMNASYQSTQIALFRVEPHGLRLVDESKLVGPGRAAFEHFRHLRPVLGSLVSPDDAVRAIHDEYPQLRHLVVVVQRLWLDPKTARVASEKEILPYLDGEPLGPGGEGVPPALVPPGG